MNSAAQSREAGSHRTSSRSYLLRWRRAGAVSLACVALSLAPSAEAQSGSAQARTLFREARALMDKGRHAEACPKLEESLRLDSGVGTQFNLAHCWEKIGRTASAWGLFMDVASASVAAGQRKRAKAAEERAAALEPQLMRLIIEVPKPSQAMSVQRSGEEVGAAAWGTAMPIDPGSHRVEVSAPGKLPWSQDVELLVPGQTVTLVVPLLEDVAPAAPEPPSASEREGAAEPVEHDRGGGRGLRTASTIAMAVLGVGGVVTGTIFAVRSNDETGAARLLCTGGPGGNVCNGGLPEQQELEEHRDRAESHAMLSYVGLGVGGAALIGAAILLITAPSAQPESSEGAALELSPTLAPGLAGVSLGGKF